DSTVQQCKAKSFSATAKEAVVLRFSGFLHDTLSHLSRVSEALQKSDISIADAHSCLSSTHAVLESYKIRDTCPNVLELIDLILTVPASTADCERGFNIMKVVKSDWRSSLKADTLSDLLLMQLSSPPISEFDPSPAIELWHTDCIRGRRPNFKDRSKRVADTDSDMSDSEADDVVIT
ncbi:hypothetical protein ABVT39_000839, partial [Epinephelus coioides]